MKKKKAATNWRKRALEAEEENRWQADSLAVFRSKFGAQSNCQALDAIDGLRHQIEVGDALLDKQRERLIRLTEIKNRADCLVQWINGMERRPNAFELSGTAWFKFRYFDYFLSVARLLEHAIAALEVDSFVPQKEKP